MISQPESQLLAYTADQVCEVLQISTTTLWRLERRGLLRSIPYLRHKRYSVRLVQQFASGTVEHSRVLGQKA